MAKYDVGNLSTIKLLSHLAPTDLNCVAKASGWRKYSANEQIFDRQSNTRDVFFVVSGRVRVVNYSITGREVTLDDIGVGGHFGELAAIDGQPRSASVFALVDSHLVVLPQERFLNLVNEDNGVGLKVMQSLAAIVRIATERIMDLSTLAANNRVQAEMLRLAVADPDDDSRAMIAPIPVHGEVASRASTTRETVARVMNDLSRRGIVERRKEAMMILDVQRLRDMVEEVRGE